MDDGLFSDLGSGVIFDGATTFSEFVQKKQPVRPHVGFQDAGKTCEVKHYDSVYNHKGDRVLLRSGAKLNLHHDRSSYAYKSALIVTQFWDRDGDESSRELEIRSPYMKAAMKAVIPEYETHNIERRHIIITNTLECLFHYRDELFAYGCGLEAESEAQKHVSYLLTYMHQELTTEISTWHLMVELALGTVDPSLDFASLWMAFKPGDLVYLPHHTEEHMTHIMKFQSIKWPNLSNSGHMSLKQEWKLELHYIDFSMDTFGYRAKSVGIPYYEGFRPLEELSAVPLKIHPDHDKIRAAHIARGKRFVSHCGHHYQRYKGTALLLSDKRQKTFLGEGDEFSPMKTWVR